MSCFSEKKIDPVFRSEAIIDVTDFDAAAYAETPDYPIGYLCDCNIFVFQGGEVEIYSNDSRNLLETFSVLDIVIANNNINNYDPRYAKAVKVILNDKCLVITFQTQASKTEFWNALSTTYGKLKDCTTL